MEYYPVDLIPLDRKLIKNFYGPIVPYYLILIKNLDIPTSFSNFIAIKTSFTTVGILTFICIRKDKSYQRTKESILALDNYVQLKQQGNEVQISYSSLSLKRINSLIVSPSNNSY